MFGAMEWTPETIISALVIMRGGATGGGWMLGRRNGRNGKAADGGCPNPMQRLHGERLAAVEANVETIQRDVRDIKKGQQEILLRLPKK